MKAFRMAGCNAGRTCRQRQSSRPIRSPHLRGRLQRFELQHLRMLLLPLQAAEGTAHTNAKPVFYPCCGLRGPKAAARAIAQAQHGAGVVVRLAAGHDGAHVSSDLGHFQTGDKAQHVVGVGADVAHDE